MQIKKIKGDSKMKRFIREEGQMKKYFFLLVLFNIFFNLNSIFLETTLVQEELSAGATNSVRNSREELMPGFPINLGEGLNVAPTVYDVDGDGDLEIVQSKGDYVWVIHHDGTIAQNWPFGTGGWDDASNPAVADINSDNITEVVVKLASQDLWALNPEAQPLTGFPFVYESVSSSTFGSTLVLAQMDDNPDDLEIIVPFGVKNFPNPPSWNEAGIFAFDNQGNLLEGFPYIFYDGHQSLHICVADIDADGENEIVSFIVDNDYGAIYVFERDGTVKSGFPFITDDFILWGSLTDIDNDGYLEIFANSLNNNLYGFNHDGTPITGFPILCPQPLWGQPIPGDIDGDGDVEIIVTGSSQIYAFHHDGTTVEGWPISEGSYVNQFPLIADIDGDGAGEIFGAFDNNVYAFYGNGEIVDGFPFSVDNQVSAAMLIADVDLDGDMELLASTSYPNNNMFMWDLPYPYSDESIQWGMFNQNPQHTGVHVIESVYEPNISISSDNFDYGTVFISEEAVDTLIVTNIGSEPLIVDDITNELDVYSASPTNFMLEEDEQIEIIINFTPISEIVYNDTLRIFSNDPNEPIVEVVLTGVGEIEVNTDHTLQKTVESIQNYPNPFNPETTISFSTTESAERTELIIYNLRGQKVKTLINEKLVIGNHSVTWNGKDDSGKSVSSGVYFYKMKTGKDSFQRKMILLK